MRILIAMAAALLIAGCDDKPNMKRIELDDDPGSEVKSNPDGKYTCLCGFKTDETTCPKCAAILKAEDKPKPPSHAKTGAEVGKSATKPRYGCTKCDFVDAKRVPDRRCYTC